MNRQIKMIARTLTALGGSLLLWASMLSDGDAPIAPVLLLAASSLVCLLGGTGLRYLCSDQGRAFRRRLSASFSAPAAPPASVRKERIIPFSKAS
ncbi:MAG: hypothetical protein IK141_01285 [Clostridia bacterium]|nr:hypothetical protein [Clostridia bacterium]